MARERAPRPGVTWERELARMGEVVVADDNGESPFGWTETRPNRETRRAVARAARRPPHTHPDGPDAA